MTAGETSNSSSLIELPDEICAGTARGENSRSEGLVLEEETLSFADFLLRSNDIAASL